MHKIGATATRCLICQAQPFSPCSVWWMQRLESSWTCRCVTMLSQLWSSYIGCRLSKELHTSCDCSCITSTLDKHHSTCQTAYPQFLHSVADAGWGRLAQWITFCQEQELDLENEVSPTVAQPPGAFFLPTSTTLLTPVHSENDSRVYFMIVLTTELLSALLDVSYSGALQISRWLIDWWWHVASRPLWGLHSDAHSVW